MSTWLIEDGEKTLATIGEKEELEKFFIQFRKEITDKNIIIILSHESGHYMQIGVGNDFGFLNYHNENDEPPYYSSVNNEIMNTDEIKDFYICGQYTEIPLRNCISFDLLLESVKQYYETGELPENIEWEED